MEAPTDAIVPVPEPAVREAILAALSAQEDELAGGWAAAALMEGVDVDGDE
jgi:hypothetical protein